MQEVSTNTGPDTLDFTLTRNRITAVGYHTRNVRNGASLSFSNQDSIVGYLPFQHIALSDFRSSADSLGNDGEITL
jgi:hypothetical protein